jgi:hypothetical protein
MRGGFLFERTYHRHGERSEAIQRFRLAVTRRGAVFLTKMDRFAALAMTGCGAAGLC